MLKYLHHIFFDPISAAEQMEFGALVFPLLIVLAFLVRLILYWIYGGDDD